jgi:hypothetical protein
MNLKQGIFVGPMPYGITWLLMPPWRSYIIHHDQSGFSHPNHKGEREKINNIYNVVNNEITEFNHGGVFMDPMPCEFTWLLMPRRGLT